MTDERVSQHVLEVLEPLLGRFTARKAVELATQQCGATVETLVPADVPCVCERLHPMLRTLVGAATATEVLEAIARPFETEASTR
jgi:hypothetical protein